MLALLRDDNVFRLRVHHLEQTMVTLELLGLAESSALKSGTAEVNVQCSAMRALEECLWLKDLRFEQTIGVDVSMCAELTTTANAVPSLVLPQTVQIWNGSEREIDRRKDCRQ